MAGNLLGRQCGDSGKWTTVGSVKTSCELVSVSEVIESLDKSHFPRMEELVPAGALIPVSAFA